VVLMGPGKGGRRPHTGMLEPSKRAAASLPPYFREGRCLARPTD
jgi:hypothetical protein